jgi:hypothetical protein
VLRSALLQALGRRLEEALATTESLHGAWAAAIAKAKRAQAVAMQGPARTAAHQQAQAAEIRRQAQQV